MKTFSKILLISAFLLAACHTEACNAVTGLGTTSNTPQCKLKPVAGKCLTGFHLANKDCLPNTWYCSDAKYDNATSNCTSCKWYSQHVQNDSQMKNGTKTGNFCETRWWFVTLIGLTMLFFVIFVMAMIKGCCTKSKKKSEQIELIDRSHKATQGNAQHGTYIRNPQMAHSEVTVHQSRPVHHQTRPAQVVSSSGHQASYSPYRSNANVSSHRY